MALELKYDERLAGAKAVAQVNGAQVFDGIRDHGVVYSVNKDNFFYLSGYYFQNGYIQYLQTTNGMYIYVDYLNGGDSNWRVEQGAIKPRFYSDTQAQQLVDKIIRNNFHILQNNLVCARYANLFTASQKAQIRELQERLNVRNNALQSEGLVVNVQTSYPDGYAELQSYLDKLMTGGGVGMATWVIVVVAAVVLAGAGTAVYYAYKAFADESEEDIKYSQELMAVLAQKLTPEEYQQLLDETKGIVTKARIKQAASDIPSWFKWGAIALGGVAGVLLLKKIVNKLAK